MTNMDPFLNIIINEIFNEMQMDKEPKKRKSLLR